MSIIKIAILDPSASKKTQVELPDDVSVRRLVDALSGRMGLPQQSNSGAPILYHLETNRDGIHQAIPEDQTLGEFGVEEGANLWLKANMPAGDSLFPAWQGKWFTRPHIADLDRIYSALEELQSRSKNEDSQELVETIREEIRARNDSSSVQITISEKELESIPMVRADRLHIVEEYRSEQNKWFGIAMAFLGAALGFILSLSAAANFALSKESLFVVSSFVAVGVFAWLSARGFEKKAERFKHITLYEGGQLPAAIPLSGASKGGDVGLGGIRSGQSSHA